MDFHYDLIEFLLNWHSVKVWSLQPIRWDEKFLMSTNNAVSFLVNLVEGLHANTPNVAYFIGQKYFCDSEESLRDVTLNLAESKEMYSIFFPAKLLK